MYMYKIFHQRFTIKNIPSKYIIKNIPSIIPENVMLRGVVKVEIWALCWGKIEISYILPLEEKSENW